MSHSTGESSASSPWEGSTRLRISKELFARMPATSSDLQHGLTLESNTPSRSYTVSRRIPTTWHQLATFSTLLSMYFSLLSSSTAGFAMRDRARCDGTFVRPASKGVGCRRRREVRDLNTRTSRYTACRTARMRRVKHDIAFVASSASGDVSATVERAARMQRTEAGKRRGEGCAGGVHCQRCSRSRESRRRRVPTPDRLRPRNLQLPHLRHLAMPGLCVRRVKRCDSSGIGTLLGRQEHISKRRRVPARRFPRLA